MVYSLSGDDSPVSIFILIVSVTPSSLSFLTISHCFSSQVFEWGVRIFQAHQSILRCPVRFVFRIFVFLVLTRGHILRCSLCNFCWFD